MKKKTTIAVEQNDLRIFLIQSLRYSIGRDNHLAPSGFSNDIKKYIPLFDKETQKYLINKLIDEIEIEFRWNGGDFENELKYKYVWEELIAWFKERLAEIEKEDQYEL